MFNKKEYNKKYYQKNKETIKKRAIEWNNKHWDKHLEYAKKCRDKGKV